VSAIAGAAIAAAGCDLNTVLAQVVEARQLSAHLLVQFATAADASNRAVLADTDQSAAEYAREAGQAIEAVQRDSAALAAILRDLEFEQELSRLEEFGVRFAEYRAVDQTILELAVEHTNRRAQQLSFDAVQRAADAFRDALQSVQPSNTARDTWQVQALAATAVASVREIQALQAPHIAEPQDAAMTELERRMAAAESTARDSLRSLDGLIAPASRPQFAAAVAALDRLMDLHGEIVSLSRRNNDVRSLALSLTEKQAVRTRCEESLRALDGALAERGFTGTR
jgi:hypothetical protein